VTQLLTRRSFLNPFIIGLSQKGAGAYAEDNFSGGKMFADPCPVQAQASSLWGIVQSAISAASGLIGVAIGALFTALNQKKQRKNDRIKDQLQNFYSPMLGMRSQIKAKSELRAELTSIAHSEIPRPFRAIVDLEKARKEDAEEAAEFQKLLDYNNKQLKEELIPLYRKMLDHFTEHLHLCEKSTIVYYAHLVEFIEIWNRFLEGSIPRIVLQKREHSEAELQLFYKDLQDNFDRLSAELRK
jgi:hypothetical protein